MSIALSCLAKNSGTFSGFRALSLYGHSADERSRETKWKLQLRRN